MLFPLFKIKVGRIELSGDVIVPRQVGGGHILREGVDYFLKFANLLVRIFYARACYICSDYGVIN
jgi:hypothetical protein